MYCSTTGIESNFLRDIEFTDSSWQIYFRLAIETLCEILIKGRWVILYWHAVKKLDMQALLHKKRTEKNLSQD